MPRQLVECVPNFSEGRDITKIDAIVEAVLAAGDVVLLGRTSDADHNRSVLTPSTKRPSQAIRETHRHHFLLHHPVPG